MIWNYVLTAALSFLLGFIAELGYLRIRGRRIILLFIPSTSRNFTLAAIALSIVVLFTVIQVSVSDQKAAECDREFREAITYNTSVTAEQRRITDRATDISSDRRKLLDQTFVDLGAVVGDFPAVRKVVSDYNTQARALSDEYERLQAEKSRLDKERKPYPDPECGR
ncbi:hypothetical protein LK459_11715 [Gordonia otitidis]|uniref:hypothetical protein n=1 Tax=Gordonia otitidis TaxID=249058 RepID=UPI001D1337FD|nr:hypothetical protein [Gordonia otitidis]UEA57314.1 hypothetical protein LK459_11715 [Gordonia otitidis]